MSSPAGSGAEPQPPTHFCEYLGEFLTCGAHKMAELSMRETAVSDSFASVDITLTWMFVVQVIRLKVISTTNVYPIL